MALFLLTEGPQLFKIVAISLADRPSSLGFDCLVITACRGGDAPKFLFPQTSDSECDLSRYEPGLNTRRYCLIWPKLARAVPEQEWIQLKKEPRQKLFFQLHQVSGSGHHAVLQTQATLSGLSVRELFIPTLPPKISLFKYSSLQVLQHLEIFLPSICAALGLVQLLDSCSVNWVREQIQFLYLCFSALNIQRQLEKWHAVAIVGGDTNFATECFVL